MRLFVAADIDEATRAQLAAVRGALRAVLDRSRVPPRVTWVKDEQAHVTLRFIGEHPEAALPALKDALGAGLGIPPFEVRWERIGTFPTGKSPRVIWVGPAAGAVELSVLAERVNERLESIVGPGEDRPFSAHLTVGRVKDGGKGVDWTAALEAVSIRPTVTRVDHVTLYVSRLSPGGPTYTAVCRADLT